jgi:hypothetical protein
VFDPGVSEVKASIKFQEILYCRPSAPMILYIAHLSFSQENAADWEIYHYIFGGSFVMTGGGRAGPADGSAGGSGFTSRIRLMLVTSDQSQETPKIAAPMMSMWMLPALPVSPTSVE